jgi:hypothetical protein
MIIGPCLLGRFNMNRLGSSELMNRDAFAFEIWIGALIVMRLLICD